MPMIIYLPVNTGVYKKNAQIVTERKTDTYMASVKFSYRVSQL